MPTVAIAHHPNMTFEDAVEVFKSHFSAQYEFSESRQIGRGQRMVIKKSAWSAVGISLSQRSGGTGFVYGAFLPSALGRAPLELIGSLISVLFLKASWRAMEAEVLAFIENEATFK